MAELFMSPRSYTYSGGDSGSMRNSSSFALGTQPPQEQGGFLGGLNKAAGVLADIVEGFQQGQRGYPVSGEPRLAGNRFMDMVLQQLEQSRARNEQQALEAKKERREAEQRGLRQQILLEGVRQGEISYEDALKALGSGEFSLGTQGEDLPENQAALEAP